MALSDEEENSIKDIFDDVIDEVYGIVTDHYESWIDLPRNELRNKGINACRAPVGQGENYKNAIALLLMQYYRSIYMGEGANRRHG